VVRIDLVGGAEASQRGGGVLESFQKVIASAFDGLDAACFEQALGKTRARGEIRGASEAGEEDSRAPAVARKASVASVAKDLERLSEAEAWEGLNRYAGRCASRRSFRPIGHLDGLLREIGKIATADQGLFPLRDIGLAF